MEMYEDDRDVDVYESAHKPVAALGARLRRALSLGPQQDEVQPQVSEKAARTMRRRSMDHYQVPDAVKKLQAQ